MTERGKMCVYIYLSVCVCVCVLPELKEDGMEGGSAKT